MHPEPARNPTPDACIPCIEVNAASLPEPVVYDDSLYEFHPDAFVEDVLQEILDSPSPKSNVKDPAMREV